MHTPRCNYQLTLHSLSEIHFSSNNLSKIGMKSISRGAILISLSLTSRKLTEIPKIFLSHYTKIKSVLFASNHSRNKSYKFQPKSLLPPCESTLQSPSSYRTTTQPSIPPTSSRSANPLVLQQLQFPSIVIRCQHSPNSQQPNRHISQCI